MRCNAAAAARPAITSPPAGSDERPERVRGVARGVGADGRLELLVAGEAKHYLVGEIRSVRESEA